MTITAEILPPQLQLYPFTVLRTPQQPSSLAFEDSTSSHDVRFSSYSKRKPRNYSTARYHQSPVHAPACTRSMQLQHPQLKENNRKAANRRPEMIRGAGPLDYTRMHPPQKKHPRLPSPPQPMPVAWSSLKFVKSGYQAQKNVYRMHTMCSLTL